MKNQRLSQQLLTCAQQQPPVWANQPVRQWDRTLYRRTRSAFVMREEYSAMASVNVFQVIGYESSTVSAHSWQQWLQAIPETHLTLAMLDSQPDAYLDTAIKTPSLSFYTADGMDFYADRDSLPWVVVARYLFHQNSQRTHLHGVTVHHDQVNEHFYHLYGQLQQALDQSALPVRLSAHSRLRYREDAAGWKADFYQTTLCWEEKGRQIELDEAAAEERLRWLLTRQGSFWRRHFGSSAPVLSLRKEIL